MSPRVLDGVGGGVTDAGAETMVADVQQVPPAHHVNVDLGDYVSHIAVTRYWDITPQTPRPVSMACDR